MVSFANTSEIIGYDDVIIDGMGNIIGVIGADEKKIMLKSYNVLKR